MNHRKASERSGGGGKNISRNLIQKWLLISPTDIQHQPWKSTRDQPNQKRDEEKERNEKEKVKKVQKRLTVHQADAGIFFLKGSSFFLGKL